MVPSPHLAKSTTAQGGRGAIQVGHDLDLAGLDLVVIQLQHAESVGEACRLGWLALEGGGAAAMELLRRQAGEHV